ncbi:hypothetical protein LTR12_017882 [Friedmanniomyces endolithicus]|nr:hypothetical protein LTR12_017882 [Friedmanniomyces endolithicus]
MSRRNPCFCIARTESNETLDSRTVALIQNLCQRLDWLNVDRNRTQVDDEAERTTVIGISEAQDYTLASLTSSDEANSMADLARHFIHMMDLLEYNQNAVSGPARTYTHCANESSDQHKSAKTPTAVYPLSLPPAIDLGSSRRTEAIARYAANSTAHPVGQAYPSAMLDALNMSGGSRPWKVS